MFLKKTGSWFSQYKVVQGRNVYLQCSLTMGWGAWKDTRVVAIANRSMRETKENLLHFKSNLIWGIYSWLKIGIFLWICLMLHFIIRVLIWQMWPNLILKYVFIINFIMVSLWEGSLHMFSKIFGFMSLMARKEEMAMIMKMPSSKSCVLTCEFNMVTLLND